MPTGQMSLTRAAERSQRGEHLCVIYDSREDQLATLEPFVRDGLDRGERCVFVFDEVSAKEMLNALRKTINIDAALARGALVIHDPSGIYVKDSAFDPDAFLEFWSTAIEAATKEQFSGFRACGEVKCFL